MGYSQAVDPRVASITAMVESIVERVMGQKFNNQVMSWMSNNQRISSQLFYPRNSLEGGNNTFASLKYFGNSMSSLGKSLETFKGKELFKGMKEFGGDLAKFGEKVGGAAGIFSAYQNGDPLGGAVSGASAFGPVGAAIGLLAGIFGQKKINRWNRPKFTDAQKAYDKLFTVDRGEQDLYYMPESFYFRAGGGGPRMITVKIGNNQFDDHIRESLTNNYASQLQRGLVF